MKQDEFTKRAMHAIAGRRQRAITRAQVAEQEVLRRVPCLDQWQSDKALAGIAMARLRIAGASEDAIATAQQKLIDLDAQRVDMLRAEGIDPQSFAPQFTCAICEDTGYYNGVLCQCVHDLVHQMQREAVNETSPLALCTFETFSLEKYPTTYVPEVGVSMRAHMETVLAYCLAYADAFTPHANSLYLCGYAGLGKTHLALSIAHAVLNKGHDVVYVSAQDVMDRIEKERFSSSSGDTLSTLLGTQLLILDDLGTEYLSPYTSACLYDIINTRYNKRLPTIYTSNILSDADLRRRYTEKIVSRLLGSCEVLYFCGEDIRLQDK